MKENHSLRRNKKLDENSPNRLLDNYRSWLSNSSLHASPLSCQTQFSPSPPRIQSCADELETLPALSGRGPSQKSQGGRWVLDLTLSRGTETSKPSALKFFPKCSRMWVELIVVSLKTILRFKQTFRDYWIKTFRNEKDGHGQAGKIQSLKQWLGLERV